MSAQISQVCSRCKKENDRASRKTCSSCAEKDKANRLKRKAKYIRENKCVVCGKKKEEGDKEKKCSRCLEVARSACQKYKERKRTEGCCSHCLQNKADEGYTTCAKCRLSQKEYRENIILDRYVKGSCTNCGGKVEDIKFNTCGKCREKSREYTNARKEKGICIHCPNPKFKKHHFCKECLKKNREINKKRKEERLKENLCVTCGKAPPENNLTTCSKCQDKSRDLRKKQKESKICACGRGKSQKRPVCSVCFKKRSSKAKTRRNRIRKQGLCLDCRLPVDENGCEPCKQKKREMTRAIKEERFRAGLCIVCGKHPAREDWASCQDCGNKRKQKYEERKESRLCSCGEEKEIGKFLCSGCQEKKRQSEHQTRKNIKEMKESLRRKEEALEDLELKLKRQRILSGLESYLN